MDFTFHLAKATDDDLMQLNGLRSWVGDPKLPLLFGLFLRVLSSHSREEVLDVFRRSQAHSPCLASYDVFDQSPTQILADGYLDDAGCNSLELQVAHEKASLSSNEIATFYERVQALRCYNDDIAAEQVTLDSGSTANAGSSVAYDSSGPIRLCDNRPICETNINLPFPTPESNRFPSPEPSNVTDDSIKPACPISLSPTHGYVPPYVEDEPSDRSFQVSHADSQAILTRNDTPDEIAPPLYPDTFEARSPLNDVHSVASPASTSCGASHSDNANLINQETIGKASKSRSSAVPLPSFAASQSVHAAGQHHSASGDTLASKSTQKGSTVCQSPTRKRNFSSDVDCSSGISQKLRLSPDRDESRPQMSHSDDIRNNGEAIDRRSASSSTREPPGKAQSRLSKLVRSSNQDRWEGRFSHHPSLSGLSSVEKDKIERIVNQLLAPDLAEFLEKHTKSWAIEGFWDHRPKSFVDPPTSVQQDPSRILRYVEAKQAEEETNFLKLRLARLFLYLQYVAECDRHIKARNPLKTAKSKAISALCGTDQLDAAAAKKRRTFFLTQKRLGERWWWCACYFEIGFLLGCSRETGYKVDDIMFQLDPFIVYVMCNHPALIAACCKFNDVVQKLLTEGRFPCQLDKQAVRSWISVARKSDHGNVSNMSCWKPWKVELAMSKASDFLRERLNTPMSILL